MKLLDLFCCAGGAGMGYHRAGFEVVGVDINPQPRYPFEFHQADALEYLAAHGHEFDVIHASPPCQAYSTTRHTHSKKHPELVEATRAILEAIGKPYVIENVVGAPLREPLVLCGTEFDLRTTESDGRDTVLRRHRLFESNVWLMGAGGCQHDDTRVGGVYGGGAAKRIKGGRRGGYQPRTRVRREIMGIDWMTGKELSQAIPPAYTEFIGAQLLAHIGVAA
jgi:DNA (cytosine-5)-methyltransferase 1